MKTVEVKIYDEDVDKFVIDALKDAYHLNAEHNKIDNSDDAIEPDVEFLKAVDFVLEYFMNANQLAEWEKEKAERYETLKD